MNKVFPTYKLLFLSLKYIHQDYSVSNLASIGGLSSNPVSFSMQTSFQESFQKIPCFYSLKALFVSSIKEGLLSVLGYCCTLCTIFGRMTGFEPELLRPGMSLMGYPYPFFTFLFALLFLCWARE